MLARAAVLVAAAVLAGCAAPESLDAIARTREADRSAPVVNYPLPFAPAEPVPVEAGDVALAPRGDGFFAAWTDELDPQTIRAVDLDASGHAKGKARVLISRPKAELIPGNAACSPVGECVTVTLVQGPGNTVAIMTSAADGTASRIEMPAGDEPVLPRVAYDGDAGSFVVTWNDGGIAGVHVAAGAAIEAPFHILLNAQGVVGLACAPGHGCLADLSGGSTPVVPITAAGAGAPVTTIDWPLDNLTYAGGVYFSTVSFGDSVGVLRQDLDGTALDAAPRTAVVLPAKSTEQILGAGFDGTAFDVAVWANVHTPLGKKRYTTIYRFLPDGTAASPEAIELGALPVIPGFSCSAGVCKLATNTTADGLAGFALATIDDDGSVKVGDAVGAAIGDQRLVLALPIGGRVFAAWYEGPILRTRWFSSLGEADGPPEDLDENQLLIDGDANGDLGLLAFADPDNHHFVGARVVSANGHIGPFVPSAPPPEPSNAPARFGTFWDFGRFALTRFDADGNQLDAKAISPDSVPNAVGEGLTRAGDTFLLLGHGLKEGKPALRLTRVRDTGEIFDVTEIDPSVLAPKSDGGIACSPDRCLWVNAPLDGRAPKSGQLAFFDPSRSPLSLERSPFHFTGIDDVLFDGRHFLSLFLASRAMAFGVTRIDADANPTTRVALEGRSVVGSAAPGDGNVVLFASGAQELDKPTRVVSQIEVWSVRGEGFVEPTGSGGGGASAFVASGGCGCRSAADAPGGFAPLVVAAALAAARRRRRRRPNDAAGLFARRC